MSDLPRQEPSPRLGFAVMFDEDGAVPEALLHSVKEAGYTGIEPNCYDLHHLPAIAAACRRVGLAIHAIPTGRWMDIAAASVDYTRYTAQAFERLSHGAAIAAELDAPLIFGLIRGPHTIAAADARGFLSTVISKLLQQTPQLQILVEPIAPGEAAWPHTIRDGAQFIEELHLPQVKLLADSYHVARSGDDLDITPYRSSIAHLHIRDDQKQIPTKTAPEYAPILWLWREDKLVLSFEPAIDLRGTLASAVAGVRWLNHEAGQA